MAVHLAHRGDFLHGLPLLQVVPDEGFLTGQLVGILRTLPPFRTPQQHTLRFLTGQSLLGPLADEVPFNLGGQAEGESEDLALDVLPQPILVLDGPDPALLGHTDVEYFHDHEQVATEAGEFRADNQIVLPDVFQEFAQTTTSYNKP